MTELKTLHNKTRDVLNKMYDKSNSTKHNLNN